MSADPTVTDPDNYRTVFENERGHASCAVGQDITAELERVVLEPFEAPAPAEQLWKSPVLGSIFGVLGS